MQMSLSSTEKFLALLFESFPVHNLARTSASVQRYAWEHGRGKLTRGCRLCLRICWEAFFAVVRIVHEPKLLAPIPEHVEGNTHA